MSISRAGAGGRVTPALAAVEKASAVVLAVVEVAIPGRVGGGTRIENAMARVAARGIPRSCIIRRSGVSLAPVPRIPERMRPHRHRVPLCLCLVLLPRRATGRARAARTRRNWWRLLEGIPFPKSFPASCNIIIISIPRSRGYLINHQMISWMPNLLPIRPLLLPRLLLLLLLHMQQPRLINLPQETLPSSPSPSRDPDPNSDPRSNYPLL
mmetsp:Transcript_28337/g.56650  ORF Transcript_28337/g.56650 Transcript_28337/m.56650 type:complete len:211 (+) Transcript_28337:177-809(+)